LLTVHIAQLRLLASIGFSPLLDHCVQCGAPITGAAWFSIRACGIICGKPSCRQTGDAWQLVDGVLECLRHCLAAPMGRLFNCRLSPAARSDFLRLSSRYLTHQMEKQYTRLQLLDDMDSMASDQNLLSK
jgi:recombinational DNA repair protein (RecF pathway)